MIDEELPQGIPLNDNLKSFALISPDNIVGNVVICDDENWVKSHPDWKDLTIVDVTNTSPRVSNFWIYDPVLKTFTAPETKEEPLTSLPKDEVIAETIPTYDEMQSALAKANGTIYTPIAPKLPSINNAGGTN
jgi:hypothetical protein